MTCLRLRERTHSLESSTSAATKNNSNDVARSIALHQRGPVHLSWSSCFGGVEYGVHGSSCTAIGLWSEHAPRLHMHNTSQHASSASAAGRQAVEPPQPLQHEVKLLQLFGILQCQRPILERCVQLMEPRIEYAMAMMLCITSQRHAVALQTGSSWLPWLRLPDSQVHAPWA